MQTETMIRIGIGYDIHRTSPDRPLWLGGIHFENAPFGLEGHSDADCLFHAICDAILGALALPDIGHHFPDTDPAYKNISSGKLLTQVVREIRMRGWEIVNIDASLIAEKPKISPRIGEMKTAIATAAGITPEQIGIKATTNEGIDEIGQGRAIAAHAVALLRKTLS